MGNRSFAEMASVAGRAMATLTQRSAPVPWKPKIAVYRHLSPFEMNPVTPFAKWLKTYKAKAIENYHWMLFPAYFWTVKQVGDSLYDQYAWEHALHPDEDE